MERAEFYRAVSRAVRSSDDSRKEILFLYALNANISHIEATIQSVARAGKSCCNSLDLSDVSWSFSTGFSREEMCEKLRAGLIEHFGKLGFTFRGTDSNYLTVCWDDEASAKEASDAEKLMYEYVCDRISKW